MSASLGLIDVEAIGKGRAREVGARKREPRVFTAQGFGCLFPFVKPYVGKWDCLFPCFDALKLRLPPNAEKRGKATGDFSAKNLVFRQGEFRVSLTTHKGCQQDFPGWRSSGKKRT